MSSTTSRQGGVSDSSQKKWTFRNVKGEVMFEVPGRTPRDALQQHIKAETSRLSTQPGPRRRVDLRGLYLKNFQLEGINLSWCDLSGSCLLDTNLRRSKLNNTLLREVRAIGVNFDSVEAYRSNWVLGNVEDCSFRCASLSGGSMYGAILRRNRMTGFEAKGVDFSHSQVLGCGMADGDLVGAMFMNSRVYRTDLSGADLSDSKGQANLDARRSDDVSKLVRSRTAGARFVGNIYDKKTLYNDYSLPELKSDKRVSAISRSAIFFPLACLGMVCGEKAYEHLGEGAHKVYEMLEPMMSPGVSHALGSVMSSGIGHYTGFGLALGAAYFVKEVIPEKIKDPIYENLMKFWTMARDFIGRMVEQGRKMVDLVVLMGKSRSMDPLLQTMDSRSRPSSSQMESFRKFASRDFGDLIVCTRNQLAHALSATSAARKGMHSPDCDLTILHAHGPEVKPGKTHGPCVVNVRGDGRMNAIWANVGGNPYVRVEYSKGLNGKPMGIYDQRGCPVMASELPPEVTDSRLATLYRFEKGLSNDVRLNDSTALRYNMSTHFVSEGVDGTVVVRRTSDRAIDNDLGPAIVKKDGSSIYLLADRVVSSQEFSIATGKKRPAVRQTQPGPGAPTPASKPPVPVRDDTPTPGSLPQDTSSLPPSSSPRPC